MNKIIWTIPNIISLYRLLALPFILGAAATGHRRLFAVLIVVNLISDILDGVLARALHQETPLGAKLDSIGDLSTYFLALLGMCVFERPLLTAHAIPFSLLVGLFVLAELVSLVKFRRMISLHLYSSKVAGYAQGFFFATLFLFGYSAVIFYPMLCICVANNLEEIAVLTVLRQPRENARGLYWVVKNR